MNGSDKHFIGIEIGGTKLQVVLGDSDARILERRRMKVEKSKGAIDIREKLAGPLKELVRKHHPHAIGIGFGGPVDHRNGKIAISHHIEGWADFDLISWIGEMTDIPCFMDNDANVAALGEARCGTGSAYDKVFYVTLGSGVGGGMISHGEIYHGAAPGESEIGLMNYDRSGQNIESQCSGWAMDARIRKYVSQNPGSILAELVKGEYGLEARFLPDAIRRGDEGAQHLLDESTDILAWGLSHVVHLFHPEIIILGGGLSLMGDLLRDKVALNLRKYITPVFQPGPEVKIASLGEDVVGVGALLLAIKNMNAKNKN
jgi:glucokinase